jgi:hypothetical protein
MWIFLLRVEKLLGAFRAFPIKEEIEFKNNTEKRIKNSLVLKYLEPHPPQKKKVF